jgi:hypothetical protein
MSNTRLGVDCCGDRYACDTTKKCLCGCRLYYCRHCYDSHQIRLGQLLLKWMKDHTNVVSSKQLKEIVAPEILYQREDYDTV